MRKSQWIIGIDEVGRGPLAGPMTVAAAAATANGQWLIADGTPLAGIKDSKQLSAFQREAWKKIILDNYIITVTSVGSKVIDKHGISFAVRLAIARCLKKLAISHKLIATRCAVVLDGGLYAPSEYKNQQTIIKGDENHPLIAAASIIAKVHRDRYMTRLHSRFPQYGFAQHKGYGTKMHCAMLKKHGLSAAHRASFCRFQADTL